MKKVASAFIALLLVCVFISCGSTDSQQQTIDNLNAFTRLYGYVKYFYPGDEAAGIDWDRFAIYGAQKVETAADRAQLKKALEELFLPIAPALVIHETGQEKEFPIGSVTPPDKEGMTVVAWQHHGVGFGLSNSIYRSHRLNREEELVSKPYRPAVTSQCKPADSLLGKEFKFSASVKVTGGHVQLWFREDRSDDEKGFFDNMNDRPIWSQEWATYEITGELSGAAQQICFGAILFNGGQAWIDNFQLQVKENGEWVAADGVLFNPDFEEDKKEGAPVGWSSSAGYTYKVLAGDAAQGKQCLSIFYNSIKKVISEPLFDEKPAFGEVVAKDLGAGLSIQMPIALYGSESQTFPQADKDKLAQLTEAIKTTVPERLTGENLYVRLGDIVITWNIFQHFYPYWDVVKTDWPAQLPIAFTSAYKDKNAQDFKQTLRRLVATLKDGHGKVNYVREPDPNNRAFPFAWEWIENQLVVTRVADKENKDVQVGDVVLEIDGVNALDALKEFDPYISSGNENYIRMISTYDLAAGKEGTRAVIKMKRGDKIHKATIDRSLPIMKYYSLVRNKREKYKKIGDDIHYMHLANISMKEIQEKLPELEKAKGIICDLRGYPNGNHDLIKHLLKEKDTHKWMFTPRVIYPDHEKVTYRESGWGLEPAEPHLSAKIVFITNCWAGSYAESYMGYIKGYKLATIVGGATAGANGNVNPFDLPGGYNVRWTGMKVLTHDGSTHHTVGVLPDVPMQRTIKGVLEGRDELLEKAIEIVKQAN